MKKITVSVDDETYRRVRMKAAEQDTSVSELVRRVLSELTANVGVTERPARGAGFASAHSCIQRRGPSGTRGRALARRVIAA